MASTRASRSVVNSGGLGQQHDGRSFASGSAGEHDEHASEYGGVAKSLHWLIVALVAIQFVVSWLMPEIGRNTRPSTLINLHFSLGVLILVVMLVRFILRLSEPVRVSMPDSPIWERWTAEALHRLFYFLLLVGPFLGWASASAHELPVNVFGFFTLPDIAAPHARWALTAGDVHKVGMWTLLALIGLHVAAALYHYFVRHDAVLQRMLPGRSASPRA
jgi:cytochrome b561